MYHTYVWPHWHHVANTTEQFVCGGSAAICKITLTTCLVFFALYSLIFFHFRVLDRTTVFRQLLSARKLARCVNILLYKSVMLVVSYRERKCAENCNK